jgi:hypothetical protein
MNKWIYILNKNLEKIIFKFKFKYILLSELSKVSKIISSKSKNIVKNNSK